MTAFRVEVCGIWRDLALSTEEQRTQVFLVAAPGPGAARTAGVQLFGGESARLRFLALPGCDARVLIDGD